VSASQPDRKVRWRCARVETPRPALWVDFQLPSELFALRPEDLADLELPPEATAAHELGLIFSGRGPLWWFAALALQAGHHPWSATFDPGTNRAIVIQQQDRPDAPRLGDMLPFTQPAEFLGAATSATSAVERPSTQVRPWTSWELGPSSDEATLRVEVRGQLLSPACLAELATWLPPCPRDPAHTLRLSGPIPVWLAAGLCAHWAVSHPDLNLMLHDPKLGAICVRPGRTHAIPLGLVVPDQTPSRPTPIVGLVGDPYSGKSVLSWKLYKAWQQRRLSVYRFDCDAASPTTSYALASSVGKQVREDYQQRRKQLDGSRGGWQPGDEVILAQCLRRIKASGLALALADLPGGIHPGRVASPQSVRVPPGREALLREVDHFVIVARSKQAEQGWRDSLAELGLADRIREVVCSDPGHAPECIPDLQSDPVPWRIHALDRALVDQNSHGVQALADRLAAILSAQV